MVKPFDHFVAAVGIGDGIDQHDEISCGCPGSWLFGGGQAIGQFEHRFGGTGFVGMQRGVEIIDGARGGMSFSAAA